MALGKTAHGAPRDLITTDLDRAVDVIRRGGLLALPTETVYGLAADATNEAAVARVYDVKGRPTGHPLIAHVADAHSLSRWSPDAPESAIVLADATWPGPCTLIVPRGPELPSIVSAGRDDVGLRAPAHPIASTVITASGTALAAPSANRFGAVSPTTAEHVLDDLGFLLDPERDAILDGGPSAIGVESTIVDCTVDPPQVLRAGAVTPDEIDALVGTVAPAHGPSRASGMLPSHYAPRAEVRLVDSADDAVALRAGTPNSMVLDHTDDLTIYARRLYAELRAADRRGVATVIAVLPPASGLGLAIRDRLEKAAAPRSR